MNLTTVEVIVQHDPDEEAFLTIASAESELELQATLAVVLTRYHDRRQALRTMARAGAICVADGLAALRTAGAPSPIGEACCCGKPWCAMVHQIVAEHLAGRPDLTQVVLKHFATMHSDQEMLAVLIGLRTMFRAVHQQAGLFLTWQTAGGDR